MNKQDRLLEDFAIFLHSVDCSESWDIEEEWEKDGYRRTAKSHLHFLNSQGGVLKGESNINYWTSKETFEVEPLIEEKE